MKYKKGDKIILEITGAGTLTDKCYLLDNLAISQNWVDDNAQPLSDYIKDSDYEAKREIRKLKAENKELKEDLEKAKIVNLNAGRLAGQNEAWELARKIVAFKCDGGYDLKEIKELFGYDCIQDIMKNLTYPEAAAKVSKWEKAKEEIKVGDIIKVDVNGLYAIVIHESDEFAKVVYADGNVYIGRKDGMTKTGRHIDIDSFFKQVGEE